MKVPPAIPADWVVLGLVLRSVVGISFGTLSRMHGGEPRPD